MEPVDLEQCQAEVPNAHPDGTPYTFATLGGLVGMHRCENKPTHIATEKEVQEDGLQGSMSVCSPCAKILRKQMPGHASFKRIK